MVFTSYFANRNIPSDFIKVQVSNTRPRNYPVQFVWDTVFPDYNTLVEPIKRGDIGVETYTDLYNKYLQDNSETIINEFLELYTKGNVVLLCYEKSGNFCHRNLLSKFIEDSLNIRITELT